MPGRLLRLGSAHAIGWAAHPRLPDYRVLVHLLDRSVVAHSVIAEAVLAADQTGAVATQCGFRIDLAALSLSSAGLGRLRFCIGETDEPIEPPVGWQPPRPGLLRVEDILTQAHRPRAWVHGATYADAAAAGMRVETIIDLLYRDYLGRPSDPHGLAHYASQIRTGAGSYDDIRRSFIDSDEYRLRRKHVDRAPGSLFSQRLVMEVAAADSGSTSTPAVAVGSETVRASELLRLDGADLVTALYRRVLRKEPDEAGLAHYLHELHRGVTKHTVIRTIAGELEAITAGVRVIDDSEADAV